MGLILPGGIPTNLRLSPDQVRTVELDGDAFQWLETLPSAVEGGDRLFVVLQLDQEKPYIIMQTEEDGSASLLWRTDHLGEDTYTALRRMRQVPLSKRLDEIEKQEALDAATAKENELGELYETLGGPMYRQLHRDGFAHGRSENFAPGGATHRRARAAEVARKAAAR